MGTIYTIMDNVSYHMRLLFKDDPTNFYDVDDFIIIGKGKESKPNLASIELDTIHTNNAVVST